MIHRTNKHVNKCHLPSKTSSLGFPSVVFKVYFINVIEKNYANHFGYFQDMPEGVRKIADFLGKSIWDNDVAKICEHCFVDNMRKNDKVNMSYWRDVKYVNDNAPGGFINKGMGYILVYIISVILLVYGTCIIRFISS